MKELKNCFSGFGVTTLYVKHLATNQDNEKNQIYLGKGLDGVLNLFPAEIAERSASESTGKRRSAAGVSKLEATVRLAWVRDDGQLYPAPNTRIIDYFQYPEIRMSGFLKGCETPPDALRRERQDLYGKRILVLGLSPDGTVAGKVLTERDDPLVASFPELPELPAARILRVLTVDGAPGVTPLDMIRTELTAIVAAGWHPSMMVKSGGGRPVPFPGAQGAGYTLEALLGVKANADKAPDRHGYEVKSFGGSRISLMTPTPDGGYQGEHSFRSFMERFGLPGVSGDGSLRFTGLHKCGVTNPKSGLVLRVRGYDPDTDSFADAGEVSVDLSHAQTGEIAASWSLARLANCWNRKHASALYITYERRESARPAHDFEYRYAARMLVGEDTDLWRLLRAIHRGLVFYDPADSIYPDGKPKVRSQWRCNAATLAATMKILYADTSTVHLQGAASSARDLKVRHVPPEQGAAVIDNLIERQASFNLGDAYLDDGK